MEKKESMNRVLHDLDGMPEWMKNRECGYTMRQEQKRHYKAAMYHIRAFRGATRALDEREQESFGRDAEILLDLIYAAVTRTGTDDQLMHKFLTYIMSYPDRVGLDGVRKGGEMFEAVKMALAQGRMEAKGYIKKDLE